MKNLPFLLFFSLALPGCVIVVDTKNLPPLPNPLSSSKPVAPAVNPTTLEREVYQQVNQYRLDQKLPPLKLDSQIISVARDYSKAMANGKATFSHDGFDLRVDTISKTVNYQRAGENLAYNFGYSDPVKQAVEGWIKSPGHQKNMVGDFNLTGIGVAQNAKGEYYFTQIFILER